MWIFTTFGFFSAVEHRDDHKRLLVRGRVREDIEALSSALHETSEFVQDTPDADYPYRIDVGKFEFAQLMAQSITSIDYDNFKNEVAQSQGYSRAKLYGNVWGQMHDAERKLDKYESGSI